jgi:hypothetical protein
MVDATSILDPYKPPSIMLSDDEMDDLRDEIAAGRLPADYMERYAEAVRKNVFGHDSRLDSKGRLVEQGQGSNENMSLNSINAYIKWCANEPDFDRELARKRKLYDDQEGIRQKRAVATRVERQRQRGRR